MQEQNDMSTNHEKSEFAQREMNSLQMQSAYNDNELWRRQRRAVIQGGDGDETAPEKKKKRRISRLESGIRRLLVGAIVIGSALAPTGIARGEDESDAGPSQDRNTLVLNQEDVRGPEQSGASIQAFDLDVMQMDQEVLQTLIENVPTAAENPDHFAVDIGVVRNENGSLELGADINGGDNNTDSSVYVAANDLLNSNQDRLSGLMDQGYSANVTITYDSEAAETTVSLYVFNNETHQGNLIVNNDGDFLALTFEGETPNIFKVTPQLREALVEYHVDAEVGSYVVSSIMTINGQQYILKVLGQSPDDGRPVHIWTGPSLEEGTHTAEGTIAPTPGSDDQLIANAEPILVSRVVEGPVAEESVNGANIPSDQEFLLRMEEGDIREVFSQTSSGRFQFADSRSYASEHPNAENTVLTHQGTIDKMEAGITFLILQRTQGYENITFDEVLTDLSRYNEIAGVHTFENRSSSSVGGEGRVVTSTYANINTETPYTSIRISGDPSYKEWAKLPTGEYSLTFKTNDDFLAGVNYNPNNAPGEAVASDLQQWAEFALETDVDVNSFTEAVSIYSGIIRDLGLEPDDSDYTDIQLLVFDDYLTDQYEEILRSQ